MGARFGVPAGKRPPTPVQVLAGVAWLVVGVVILVALNTPWHVVAGVFALGVGAFWLRGPAPSSRRRRAPR